MHKVRIFVLLGAAHTPVSALRDGSCVVVGEKKHSGREARKNRARFQRGAFFKQPSNSRCERPIVHVRTASNPHSEMRYQDEITNLLTVVGRDLEDATGSVPHGVVRSRPIKNNMLL